MPSAPISLSEKPVFLLKEKDKSQKKHQTTEVRVNQLENKLGNMLHSQEEGKPKRVSDTLGNYQEQENGHNYCQLGHAQPHGSQTGGYCRNFGRQWNLKCVYFDASYLKYPL